MKITDIHNSLINSNVKKAIEQTKKYGIKKAIADYNIYLYDYSDKYHLSALSYFIKNVCN